MNHLMVLPVFLFLVSPVCPAASADLRLTRCLEALGLLAETGGTSDRAERTTLIFSDPD